MNEELRDKLIESVEKEFKQYKSAMLKLTANDLWNSADYIATYQWVRQAIRQCHFTDEELKKLLKNSGRIILTIAEYTPSYAENVLKSMDRFFGYDGQFTGDNDE
uniref:Uncharacterized protein n=1 Tax=Siphoviridae sp. ctv4j104 TaxID=2826510 RepID=A0A8S5MA60_9CAUD|nr:MAG TPA: Protein of unknown function (DUF3848) [Siphoviridae sp. ctv4j104]